MADKPTTPETPEGAPQPAPERSRRKKRAAPTIDLTATEVAQAQETASSQPDPPPAADEATPQPADTAPAETPATARAPFGLAMFAAGAAGAVAALLVVFGLWISGLLPLQVATPAGTSQQAATDTKVLGALTERISKIEQAIGKITPDDGSMAERVAAIRSSISSLSGDLVALYRHNDEIAASATNARTRAEAAQKAVAELGSSVQELAKKGAAGISSAELDALQNRIAALEQSAKLARADIAKASSADIAARLALSTSMLRDAVTSGAPFEAELTQLKSLGGDDKVLATLMPFAATGVPTAPALAQELHTRLPAMLKISGAMAPEGGFLERLQANAGKLVRIRPVTGPVGDEPSAVLARLEIDTSKADIAAALSDLDKLDSATRASAQAWIAKAQARQAAIDAARKYAADAARALGSKAGAQ